MHNKKHRVGIGFDAHRFIDPKDPINNSIMLCGYSVPSKYSVIAHSDGDVALHALTDALLGAISAGDIGIHFPPTDQKFKDSASKDFVIFAHNLIKQKGGSINNIDITIISETPKISPYREKLVKSLSEILDISTEDISVKATTTEKMGFTGREEGIACQAIVSIYL